MLKCALSRNFQLGIKQYKYENIWQKCKMCQKLRNNLSNNEKNVEYIPIYKFDYIWHINLVNRLKYYQTLGTALAIPTTTILNQVNVCSAEDIYLAAMIGSSLCLMFYGLGILTNNFIGFIYYNKKLDTVKIAYCDFWGRRKEKILPTNDIVPFSELPQTYTQLIYTTFRTFSDKEKYKFSKKYATILDKDLYYKVFLEKN